MNIMIKVVVAIVVAQTQDMNQYLTQKPLCHTAPLPFNDPLNSQPLLLKLEGANHW